MRIDYLRGYLWYLLPGFFIIAGGLLAYYLLRKKDHEKAKNCLWLGIIITALYLGYYTVFSLMIEMFEFT